MKEKILIGGLTVGILLGSTPGLAENFNKLDANTSYISYRMDNKSKEALIKSKQDYINNKKKNPVTNKTEALKNKEDFIKNKQEIINNNKAEGLKNKEEALKNKEDFIKNKQEVINNNKAEGLKNKEESLKNKEDFIKNKQEIINNNKAEGLKNKEEALKNKEDFIKNKQEVINNNKAEGLKNKEEALKNKEDFIKNKQEVINNNKAEGLKNKEEALKNKEDFIKNKQEIINKVKLKDIKKDNWFYDDVQELVELGGLSGYEDGTFRPNNKISFGEFLKLSMTSIGQTKYERINGEHWAMPYYNEAIKEGIIKTDDFGNTAVDFNRPISREDMSYIIMNINSIMQDEKFEDTAGVEENIRDYKNINPNRRKQVYQAYKKGIITGKGNGFNPKDSTTRAEAATVIMRSLNPENRANNR